MTYWWIEVRKIYKGGGLKRRIQNVGTHSDASLHAHRSKFKCRAQSHELMDARDTREWRKSPPVGILFYLGQWQTPKAEEEERCWTGEINEWMEGRWSGGQEGKRCTENAYLEKSKKQINEDMASENVAREVILSLIYPLLSCNHAFYYLFIRIVQVQVTISDDKWAEVSWNSTCVQLTAFCGGLGGSSPGLFLPKQATLHASLNSLLNTVKTSTTHRPCGESNDRRESASQTQARPSRSRLKVVGC